MIKEETLHLTKEEIVQQLPYEKELRELFDYDRFVFFILDYQSGARKLLFELDKGLGFGMRVDWIWDLYDYSRKI